MRRARGRTLHARILPSPAADPPARPVPPKQTGLQIELKRIPCRIERINMRSYGAKPKSFTSKVPSGLLPVVELDGRIVTESLVIMQMLEQEFPGGDFGPYGPAMLPAPGDAEGLARANKLLKLERVLFSDWCGLVFRPSVPGAGLFGGGAMGAFEKTLSAVDEALGETAGHWFMGGDAPTIVDLQYVSHVERMNASALYWKGMQLRGAGRWKNIDKWFDAFEQLPEYRATQSDYYTHVMDIPPQYGPGFSSGGDKQERAAAVIDGANWRLPLKQSTRDAEPLTAHAEAAGEQAAREEAAWELSQNGDAVARFACRGMGEADGRYGAPLADPMATPDLDFLPRVDEALRHITAALLDGSMASAARAKAAPAEGSAAARASASAAATRAEGEGPAIAACLEYLQRRVGVPRDMSFAAAQQLRAHIEWYKDRLSGN